MRNLFSHKQNIFTALIFLYLIFNNINISLSATVDEIELGEIGNSYIKTINDAINEKCLSYSITLKEEEIKSLKNLYIHFSSYSETNNQQILYYSTIDCPSTSNAEKYNYKYSDLFINFPNTKTFYLTVKCNSYPCSFSLDTTIEKDYANLNLTKSDTYSYFISPEDKLNNMIFKIPSSMEKTQSKNINHILTISLTNPSDLDYNQLYLVEKGNKIPLRNISYYKTSMDIIYTFIEEDIISEYSDDKFYALEVNSMKNQFVSISVKTSIYDIPLFMITTDIIPNTNEKYSYLFPKTEKQVNED